MGATNCPETPRQKMISMMYLVYLALLALNVSAMLLNSFITVSDTMDKSNLAVMGKVEDTYTKFANFATTNPEKAGDHYKKALEVKRLSEELRDYIDSITHCFSLGPPFRHSEFCASRPVVNLNLVIGRHYRFT